MVSPKRLPIRQLSRKKSSIAAIHISSSNNSRSLNWTHKPSQLSLRLLISIVKALEAAVNNRIPMLRSFIIRFCNSNNSLQASRLKEWLAEVKQVSNLQVANQLAQRSSKIVTILTQ